MAETLTLNKRVLQRLADAPPGTRMAVKDEKQPGLIAERREGGTVSLYLYKRIQGRPSKVLLGKHPEISVEQARKAAARMLGRIADGHNPASEKRAARVEHTLGGLFDHWLETYAKLHRRSWAEDERVYKRYLASWRTRRLSGITKADVEQLHAKLGEDHGHVTANRTVALLRAIYNKAESIGYRGPNPAKGIRRFAEQARERFLMADELPKFFRAIEAEEQWIADFFTLALLTGARRGNVQSMCWADVHLDVPCWEIPRTKSGKPVLVHLPAAAVEILERRKDAATGKWVFPGGTAVGHMGSPKVAWKRIINRAGLPDLKMHDLRRSLGSWLAIGGASLPVIGKVLGHRSTAATAVYARLSNEPVRLAVTAATNAIMAGKGASNGEA